MSDVDQKKNMLFHTNVRSGMILRMYYMQNI